MGTKWIIRFTQVGGHEEYRGTIRYYSGALQPGVDAHSIDGDQFHPIPARRFETRADADTYAAHLRTIGHMRPQQIDVVEVEA
jgi:hypothetical protein